MFRFDYLMPVELFPAALIGGGLLVWVSLRARSRRGLMDGASTKIIPTVLCSFVTTLSIRRYFQVLDAWNRYSFRRLWH